MRILFAAAPEIALPSLIALFAEHTICAVLTNPDREEGRGRRLAPSPVKEKAIELGLRVLQPERLDGEARSRVAALEPELLVVVAFGRIFGPKFLALFPSGGINLHPSLLPKYRGPAPIPAAILAGERETGITVQRLAPEMDSGDILAQIVIPLSGRETTESLTEIAGREGAALLAAVCRDLTGIKAVRQNHALATYCTLLRKEAGLVDWTQGAAQIDRMIRAYLPWPRARTTWKGAELHLLKAEPAPPDAALSRDQAPGRVLAIDKSRGILVQTGDGVLTVQMLQLRSKSPLHWKDFLNGVHDFIGSTLGG